MSGLTPLAQVQEATKALKKFQDLRQKGEQDDSDELLNRAKLKEGEITPVLKTKEGFVIYRVDTRKTAARIPLETVRQEIQQRIFMQKYTPELDRFVAGLKEDAYIQIFGDTK